MESNAELLKRAYRILPGNSLGTFYLPEGHEFVIERGAGSRVWDVEGREYIMELANPRKKGAPDYSLTHTDADIDRTLEAVEDALRGIGGRR